MEITLLGAPPANATHGCLRHTRTTSGFPSPADEFREPPLGYGDLFGAESASLFFMRVRGALPEQGWHDNDIIAVERDAFPFDGALVVIALDGELTLRQLTCRQQQWWLCAPGGHYADLPIAGNVQERLWGIVRHHIHSYFDEHQRRSEIRI
ncbi:LexA family protein [Kushneria phosphatilytica]|uniref:Uncharacterized protein n=1 Tax=Kushneria phosphatilytica TaxID=657387 RepID=A0A1S1NUA4_9GAMM|nr:S24 family peptidase [Kushneria phosphatilytica]OHV09931.1 hypothetical protein BH688_09900 [Kushneria phosphatilytica]QEL11598.1 hypothetical protein FY550_10970 [Kushneria phosphatilytica]